MRPPPRQSFPVRCADPQTARRDLHKHPVESGSLVKLIVAVTVGTSIAAAALGTCRTEIQRASSAKAFQVVAQIESLKVELRKEIDFGERPPPITDADLASQLLQRIITKGVPLSGVPETDAVTLGFRCLSVGTLDAESPDGSIISPGAPARVILRSGVTVAGPTH